MISDERVFNIDLKNPDAAALTFETVTADGLTEMGGTHTADWIIAQSSVAQVDAIMALCMELRALRKELSK